MNRNRATVLLLVAVLLVTSILSPVGETANAAGSQILKWGSRGTQVTQLQTSLKNLGYFNTTVTGYYGKVTQDAVIKFQQAQGLRIDGIVGPQTFASINRLSASKTAVSRSTATVLYYGMTSSKVYELQNNLKTLGYFYGNPTGYFGPTTKQAVMAWQKVAGLKVDGIAGAGTLASIDKALTGTSTTTSPSKPATTVKENGAYGSYILGYAAVDYEGDNASYNSVIKYGSMMDAVATFTYRVTASGKLIAPTGVPQAMIKDINNQKAKPLVMIHNFSNGFDKEVAHSILSDANKRWTLAQEVLRVIEQDGYKGVNVDIEGIYPSDRNNYIAFLRELKAVLDPKGYAVTAAIPAKVKEDPTNSWSSGYNYQEIAKYVDYVLLMTYDEHWIGGTPGPIASYPWVDQVLRYATSQIPSDKILLGLANYGYDWSPAKGRSVSYPNAVAKAKAMGATIQWHETYQEPYYYYWDKEGKHEVWFNNEHAAKARIALAKKYGIAGVGIWRLGFEDANYWTTLQANL